MNLQVLNDSPAYELSGFNVARKTDRQFPPKLSRKTDVSIELRYGMCPDRCPSLDVFLCKARTTYPVRFSLFQLILEYL